MFLYYVIQYIKIIYILYININLYFFFSFFFLNNFFYFTKWVYKKNDNKKEKKFMSLRLTYPIYKDIYKVNNIFHNLSYLMFD